MINEKLKHHIRRLDFLVAFIVLLIVLTLAFIWGRSMKSIPESQAESMGVLGFIRPILELVMGKGNATDHHVRKLAHFVEFFALGVELVALQTVQKRQKLQNLINCLFAGLSAAVIDESIQILSNRGPQVQDILLDFTGCCCGIFFAYLIIWFISIVKRRNIKKRES